MRFHPSNSGFFLSPLRLSLLMSVAIPAWSLLMDRDAHASCTFSANLLTLNCTGTLTAPHASTGASDAVIPITVYDAAAAFQPIAGSNAYTPANPAYPAGSNPNNPGYNPNPPNVVVNFDNTVVYSTTTNTTAGVLADRGMVAANFSNSEQPVNNVVINNAGILSLTTSQIAQAGGGRMDVLVGDSQVNSFTVNNKGTVSVTQTFFGVFNPANLTVTSSGAPATNTAKYSGSTMADMADFYSDDNTNSYVVNNAAGASALATGNYATVVYGRADTTITNSGTLSNTSWSSADTLKTGHWAIATWAGTDYVTAPNTNPDSTIVLLNPDGSVSISDTSATTITNKKTGVIKGDILAVDVTPLVYAANNGNSAAVSGGNAGPRDSNIENYGLITGSFYLGSGTHVLDNAIGATINGNISVDQRASQASYATPNAGGAPGTYLSVGGADFNGNACSGAGTNTTDAGCAGTHNVLASFFGGRSFTFTNEGTFAGNITINDQPGSVNSITLTGSGYTGNIAALNGTGSNSLVLSGVTGSGVASVQNFTDLNLTTSNVTIPGGVTLVPDQNAATTQSTLETTLFGPGGTAAAPSSKIGSINGSLALTGPTLLTPTIAGIARNGDVYQIASSVTGPGASEITVQQPGSALVSFTANTSTGALLLNASVLGAASVPGLSKNGFAALSNLLSYGGSNAGVQSLGGAIENLSSLSAVRGAAEQLRPEVNGASIQAPLDVITSFQSQIDNRLDSLFYGALAGQQGRSADYNPPREPIIIQPASGGWGNGFGGFTDQQTANSMAGYKAQTGGIIGGYDRLFGNNFRLGAGFGYASSEITDIDVFGRHQSMNLYQGLLYGAFVQSNWYVNGSFGIAGLNYDSTRSVVFPGFSDVAKANYGGILYSGRLDTGYAVPTAFGILVPIASITYAHIDQDAYTESSQRGIGLSIAKQSTDSVRSGVGLKAVLPILVDPTFAMAVEARAVYQREFADTAQVVSASFAGAGNSFQAIGPTPSRDMGDFGAAFRFSRPLEGESFSISYNAIVRERYVEQVGMLRARIDF